MSKSDIVVQSMLKQLYLKIQVSMLKNAQQYIDGSLKGRWSIGEIGNEQTCLWSKEYEKDVEAFLKNLSVFWDNKDSPYRFIFTYHPQNSLSIELQVFKNTEHPDYNTDVDDFMDKFYPQQQGDDEDDEDEEEDDDDSDDEYASDSDSE